MRDPEIYPFIIDDSCPVPEDIDSAVLLQNRSVYVLGWHENDFLAGMWLFYRRNAVTYQVHICAATPYRGKAVVEASVDAIDWMFRGTKCRKVIALVPDYQKRVKMIAKAIGFDREGKLKNSFLKDGKLVDEVIYGLCKGGGE